MPLYPRPTRSRPSGQPNTPFDPQTGAGIPLGDPSLTIEFTVIEVGHDILLCRNRDGREELVAKVRRFRKSDFVDVEEGEEVGGITYVSTGLDTRTATDSDSLVTVETVTPPYVVGEKIMAAKIFHLVDAVTEGEFENPGMNVGDYRVNWEDTNRASRRWVSPDRSRALLVTNRADGNLLDCQFVDHDSNQIGAVVVARGDDLQSDFYDGITFGGVAYVKVDKDTRTADGTETQEVTPDYVAGKSILKIELIVGGTGQVDPLTGLTVFWIDSTPGRAWAKQ